MLIKKANKALIMRWLQQMNHLMNDHILHKVFRLLDQFGIQPNMPCFVVATTHFVFMR